MLVYIADKYRGNVAENIANARKIAIEVWQSGNTAICPHLNTMHFEKDCDLQDDVYLQRDLEILSRCDCILMGPTWIDSEGAKAELEYAKSLNMPIFIYPDMPTVHKTETERPNQCRAFREITCRMYRLHLEKNCDYSSANILATGEIGVVTRLWDKVARLMSLTGFHFDVTHTDFIKPRKPKNESIDDTLIDAANYAVIGQILRAGLWGK